MATMGRPSAIGAVVGHTEPTDGTPPEPILLWQRIVEAVRVGNYLEPACKRAGVPVRTAYSWLETAGKLLLRARDDVIDPATLTEHEAHCLDFLHGLDEAEGMWEVTAVGTLERLARGGVQTIKTVTKRGPANANGQPGPVLEVTTTVETLAPNAQVLEWRLTRRHQERWSQHLVLDDERGVSLSDDERAELLVETLDTYLADVAAAVEVSKGGKAKAGNGARKRKPGPNGSRTPKPNGDTPS